MSKEKAADGEKETSKGGFASEQTPHPSSCPFRCSSSSHTNRFAGFAWEPSPPLQTPLKRPRRGQRPPSLDFPRGLVRAEIISDLQNAIQMRIWQTGEVIEILCVCFGCILYGRSCGNTAYRLPYVKYSTGADRTTRTVLRALGKPNRTAARRAFGLRKRNENTHNETTSFSGAKRYSRPQRSFLPYLFCQDRKDMAAGGRLHLRCKLYSPLKRDSAACTPSSIRHSAASAACSSAVCSAG